MGRWRWPGSGLAWGPPALLGLFLGHSQWRAGREKRAVVTFLCLCQGPLQLPHVALGLGTLALHLTQPAAQALHLDVGIVLGRGTEVSRTASGQVEG